MQENFRLANSEDLSEILNLFQLAIDRMNALNIQQWDEIYPDKQTLACDIEQRQMYLYSAGTRIAAVIVLNSEQDDQYANGNWSADDEFGVIHRLCVHPDFSRRGLGKQMVLFAEEHFKELNLSSVRLDAFTQNPISLHLYQTLGYQRVGQIVFRKGDFVLFEKIL